MFALERIHFGFLCSASLVKDSPNVLHDSSGHGPKLVAAGLAQAREF